MDMKGKDLPVKKFLYSNHISTECYNFEKDLESYLNEMQKGLDSSSSMPMLPTYIEEGSRIPPNKPVLVLDAGGTNFRAAVVHFTKDNEPVISQFRKRGMPGILKEHTKEEFFNEIVDFITDLTDGIEQIGFCFSYPMVKTAEKDGRLTGFSKEIKAREVVGELIGRGVLDTLEKRGISGIRKIVLLNDTVATLLAGRAAGRNGEFDEFVGLIYGTGVNASYNEKNSRIGKVDTLPENGSQLINMEAGSCGIFESGKADARYRETTSDSEAYKFEKMVSGGYLGTLWFSVLRSAADAGCFSDKFSAALESSGDFGKTCNAADLSAFLSDQKLPEELKSRAESSDLEVIMEISQALTARAAYLASVMIAGILTKTGKGRSADKPICLCIDGTTFWNLYGLKEQVISNIDSYFKKAGIFYEIRQIENAPIIGAAVAGLTNN